MREAPRIETPRIETSRIETVSGSNL